MSDEKWRECFVCGKGMQPSFQMRGLVSQHEAESGDVADEEPGSDLLLPPAHGTDWDSTGNYGSSLWDPITGSEAIHIVICDDCLDSRKDRVVRYHTHRKVERLRPRPWDPKED
jgi:hypothetical protein